MTIVLGLELEMIGQEPQQKVLKILDTQIMEMGFFPQGLH
jgi:hypothetical protein